MSHSHTSKSEVARTRVRPKNITLCDLAQAYSPTSGGIRTYLDRKRKYLDRYTDWRHVLVVPGPEDRVESQGRHATYYVAAPRVPGTGHYRFMVRGREVRRILREERPEIIELASSYYLPWVAFAHRKRFPCRVLGFYHTDYPEAYVRNQGSKMVGRTVADRAADWSWKQVRAVYNRFDRTFAASEEMAGKLRAHGVTNVEPILLGVDLDIFHPDRRDDERRRSLGLGAGDVLLIYAGRLDSEKRTLMLAEAFLAMRNPRCRMVFVGEGPQKKALQELAGSDPRLDVLPYETTREGLARLLASADLYVTAGPHETFGLSVAEAQASGLPVVGVRAGALIDRVTEGTGFLARPDDREDLTRCFELAASSDLSAMALRAFEHSRRSYSWTDNLAGVHETYVRLLRDPEPAAPMKDSRTVLEDGAPSAASAEPVTRRSD